MFPDVFADAYLVWAEPGVELRNRTSAYEVAVDYGSGVQGSLLRSSSAGWHHDVPGIEDDSDDDHRPAASADDENHAANLFGDVCSFSFFERLGVVYFDQQPGGYPAAMVSDQVASSSSPGQANARQELRPARLQRGIALSDESVEITMTKELVREGKLDRAATADALLEFLQNMLRVGGLEWNGTVLAARPCADGV